MDNTTTYIIRYVGDSKGLQALKADLNNLSKQTDGLTVTQKRAEESSKSFGANILRLAGRALLTIPIWIALRGVVMGFMNALGDAGKLLVEVEDAMIEFRMIGAGSEANLSRLRDTVIGLGLAYGVTAKDSLGAAKLFAQQGLSIQDTISMTRTSMIGSQLLGATVTETAENLTAAIKAYKMEVGDSIGVIDKWMAVQKNFAVTSKDLADATKTAGATAAAFGIEYEQFLGHITAIIEVTRKSGTQAANALQAVYTRLFSEGGKAIQELGKVPIFLSKGQPTFDPTNIYRKAPDVIDDLAEAWKTLNDAEKIELATKIGSRRQATPFVALMENYNQAIKAQVVAYTSAGEALRDWAIKQDSATVKIKQMQSAWAELVVAVGDTSIWKGLLDSLGNIANSLLLVINRTKGLQSVYRGITETKLLKAETALTEAKNLKELIILRDKYNKKAQEARTPAGKARATSMAEELNQVIGDKTVTEQYLQDLSQTVEENRIQSERNAEWTKASELTGAIMKIQQSQANRKTYFSEEALKHGVYPAIEAKETIKIQQLREERDKILASLSAEATKRVSTKNVLTKAAEWDALSGKYDEQDNAEYNKRAKEIMEDIQHRANVMSNLGVNEEAILKTMLEEYQANEKLIDSTDAYNEKRKITYKLIENEAKLIGEYAGKLESAFSTAFKDLLMGEQELGTTINNLTNNVRETFMSGLGESLSEGLMTSTGLGQFFGGGMSQIKHMFSGSSVKAGAILEDNMVTGAQRAAPILTAAMTTGGVTGGAGGSFASSATGGIGGGLGAIGGMMGGMFPFLNEPIGGVKSGMYSDLATGKLKNAGGQNAPTYGNLMGGMTTGALMGYSQYQSMTSRGASPGYAAAASGMTGLGSMLLMSGPSPAAGIGMVLIAAGTIMQALQKGKTTTVIDEQTRTEQKQVTSKIDVTNKQLEIVNRNLVAMREDLSYVMQSSYYFREKTAEDRYSIDSQRGNM